MFFYKKIDSFHELLHHFNISIINTCLFLSQLINFNQKSKRDFFHIFDYYHPHISKEICKQKLNLMEYSITLILTLYVIQNLRMSKVRLNWVSNPLARCPCLAHLEQHCRALASFLSRGFPGTRGSSVPFVSSVLDQSSSGFTHTTIGHSHRLQ